MTDCVTINGDMSLAVLYDCDHSFLSKDFIQSTKLVVDGSTNFELYSAALFDIMSTSSNITTAVIVNSRITSLETMIYWLNKHGNSLKIVNTGLNDTYSLIDAFYQNKCQRLTTLELHNTCIYQAEWDSLFRSLTHSNVRQFAIVNNASLKSLDELDLYNTNITALKIKDDAGHIEVESMTNLLNSTGVKYIERLVLSHPSITYDDFDMTKFVSLEHMRLNGQDMVVNKQQAINYLCFRMICHDFLDVELIKFIKTVT